MHVKVQHIFHKYLHILIKRKELTVTVIITIIYIFININKHNIILTFIIIHYLMKFINTFRRGDYRDMSCV